MPQTHPSSGPTTTITMVQDAAPIAVMVPLAVPDAIGLPGVVAQRRSEPRRHSSLGAYGSSNTTRLLPTCVGLSIDGTKSALLVTWRQSDEL